MNFRQAKGKQTQRLDTGIEQHFSNFLFIDQHYASNPVLRRIFSLARKHQFHSLLIEEIEESDCGLLASENQAMATRQSDFEKSEVHRITFFRTDPKTEPKQSDFIGYVVFKRDYFKGLPQPRVHVFESVMPPVRQVEQNNFIHCRRNYEVQCGLGKFVVNGVLYAQQNNLTNVCAHVGLRSVLACVLPEGDISYERINALAGIDHKGRRIGGKAGLEPVEMEAVLNGLNVPFDKVVHEPSQQLHLPTEYQRDLYGFIESGFPALVGFELDDPTAPTGGGSRHVIPVFGHTFNEDTWMPQAQRAYFGGRSQSYFPSENWLSTFVVHDDNFGPYLCLPRHFLKRDNFRLMYGLKARTTAFSALEAEAIGFSFCDAITNFRPRTGNDWYDRFVVFTKGGWLVLRTVLLKKEDYLKHLEKIQAWDGADLEREMFQKFKDHLPPVFWMVEASAPELFNSSRRKFGEVLLPCDKPLPSPLNDSVLLAARLPGLIFFRPGQLPLEIGPSQLRGHTPLFTFPTDV
jgi:hypothetical protein